MRYGNNQETVLGHIFAGKLPLSWPVRNEKISIATHATFPILKANQLLGTLVLN